jgi:hypothetical protein
MEKIHQSIQPYIIGKRGCKTRMMMMGLNTFIERIMKANGEI